MISGGQSSPCCATQPVLGTLPAIAPHLLARSTGHLGPSEPHLGPVCCRNPQPIIFDLADRLVYAMPRKQMLGESAEGIMAACEHSLAAANTITRLQTPEQQGAGPLQQQVMPCMPPCSSLLLGPHLEMQGTPLCSSGLSPAGAHHASHIPCKVPTHDWQRLTCWSLLDSIWCSHSVAKHNAAPEAKVLPV